ncbi:hypothetical protein I552_8925 [Mycobacterium xenopi 3993]|nr:hypothetical protein I552_8925 [Mycobacterium xenopi 3993]
MGWSNGPPSWAEMERVLAGKPVGKRGEAGRSGSPRDKPAAPARPLNPG